MGLFTPFYLKPKLSTRQKMRALTRIEAMRDQKKLATIARDAPDADLWRVAIWRLSDPNALAELSIHGLSRSAVALERLKALGDQVALARVAIERKDKQGGTEALALVRDEALLARIVEFCGNDWTRSAAADALRGKAVLERIARNSTNPDARSAAVYRLDDQGLLKEIAERDPEKNVRYAAARSLKDPAALARIATGDRDSFVCKGALDNRSLFSDPNFNAAAIVDTSYSEAVRLCILKYGRIADPAALSRVAQESPNPRLRSLAAQNPDFNDPALLGRLALEDGDAGVRASAVGSPCLGDTAIIERVAREDESTKVRLAAIRRVKDADVLAGIADERGPGDLMPRWLAAVMLSRCGDGRTVEPLVRLMKDDPHSDIGYDLRKEAILFLEARYKSAANSTEGRTIATLRNGRYGCLEDGCLHGDMTVHFDLPR